MLGSGEIDASVRCRRWLMLYVIVTRHLAQQTRKEDMFKRLSRSTGTDNGDVVPVQDMFADDLQQSWP